ncbi:hypothetical protein CFH99_01880 [Nocardioides aromaticivorans]|uniref:Integral membrane protein n=1 Tax=Nocardioides aromaticivorans TaxID=200618 RepID=A0ABX7PEW4_9ACTN|nr:hypothetical protein [Nocardioides aromaticivorans]QSR24373.1 hypothetical protein CFH99_01880 [Nocardioides aromaticivorans]
MTERVRVTGPPRHTTSGRPASRLGDVHEQTALGDVYLRSLLREQLGLALAVLTALGLTLGLLPLAFHLWPGLVDVEVAGAPLAWLLLGVVVYPFLLLLGWRYVRSVERNEQDFADLVQGGSEEAS